ncbi:VanZ family protein [Corynebacterium sp. 320]|uniref:VanZ family protein n=1 Tax=Corynebacterium TaxID=1716 RepID=UPI00125CAA9C|nr:MULTISPECIES: VanZ family protein [Corynebacterium]KAB1503904.1 VanZ family protein [Corynebacterium sp. 320]KAB1552997.1 VanZ family protein [Corynebacterium sp. 321]KAB1553783.1 VanZ family protein [Corynebacterium sp. 319]KAB3528040.1 VanZ family protein [Corynebacterium sp. 250]KAB3540471.1 VanZ family protein [Corynebacterium sp. 366]
MTRALATRQATGITLGVVSVVVFILTLGKSLVSLAGLWSTEAHNQRSLDFILFNDWFRPTVWYAPLTNTFGNILLFLPLGFLLMNLHRRSSLRVVALIGLAISLSIETLQYIFALGYSDIDDVLFNTLGAVCGALLARRLSVPARGAVTGIILVSSLAILALMALTN